MSNFEEPPSKPTGYVKKLIREQKAKNSKNAEPATRARKGEKISVSLAKVIKKAASIADLMTGEDQEEDLRILREAKRPRIMFTMES